MGQEDNISCDDKTKAIALKGGTSLTPKNERKASNFSLGAFLFVFKKLNF